MSANSRQGLGFKPQTISQLKALVRKWRWPHFQDDSTVSFSQTPKLVSSPFPFPLTSLLTKAPIQAPILTPSPIPTNSLSTLSLIHRRLTPLRIAWWWIGLWRTAWMLGFTRYTLFTPSIFLSFLFFLLYLSCL